MESFRELVNSAVEKAIKDAAPFVPSRTEVETAIDAIVVSRLKCMDKALAIDYIRHSYVIGWCTVAVQLYKNSLEV